MYTYHLTFHHLIVAYKYIIKNNYKLYSMQFCYIKLPSKDSFKYSV